MRRPTLAALLTALALLGCGGDQLTADEYRREAGRICEEGDRATDRVRRPASQEPRSVAAYFDRLLGANQRVQDRFEQLEPPDELSGPHDEAIAINRQGAEEVGRLVEQLRGGADLRRTLGAAQGRLQRLDDRADAVARRLGVPACAED